LGSSHFFLVIPAKAGIQRLAPCSSLSLVFDLELVIPAKAGIQFLALLFFLSLQVKSYVSPCGRAGYFLSLPQKVTKKV
jgi:hypothetical protein